MNQALVCNLHSHYFVVILVRKYEKHFKSGIVSDYSANRTDNKVTDKVGLERGELWVEHFLHLSFTNQKAGPR